jgi:hypothetical protein
VSQYIKTSVSEDNEILEGLTAKLVRFFWRVLSLNGNPSLARTKSLVFCHRRKRTSCTAYEAMAENKEYKAHDVEGSHPLMVHVTAPTSLPEGYSFEAVIADGTPFSCKVVGTIYRMYGDSNGIKSNHIKSHHINQRFHPSTLLSVDQSTIR